jgi:hypothetical protein
MFHTISNMYVRIVTVAGIVATVPIGAGRAAAQQTGAVPSAAAGNQPQARATPSLHVAWSGPSLSAPDVARLSGIIARADTMAAENRISDAARLYWSVVAEQRAAAEYPADALRRLAVLYFGANEEYVAAAVFMELAESAGEFGDATTRLRSFFDAALMYQRLGRTDRVAECVGHIWPLLKSPTIPPSIRADFMARITER